MTYVSQGSQQPYVGGSSLPPSSLYQAISATSQAGPYPKGDGSFSGQVAGTTPQVLDEQLAMMANDVYAADNPQTEQALQDAGWTRLQPSADGTALVDAQGREIPIDPDLLSTGNGFDAAIYQNDQGQYVVAYRGTDNWSPVNPGDADDNALQGLGFETGQYSDAIKLAKTAERVLGDGNVIVTGHSLGGGLASAAALATGASGVTFNAAGLSNQTLESLGFNPNAVRDSVADSGQLRRYVVDGDPLTAAQQDIPSLPIVGSPPNAIGHELRVAPPAGIGGLDLAGLHGGGGDGASYVEALQQNTPYDPALQPTLPEQAGSLVDRGLDGLGDLLGGVLDAGGRPILGSIVDGGLDLVGDGAEAAIGFGGNVARDAVERYGEWQLNNIGAVARQGADLFNDVRGNVSETADGISEAVREQYGNGDYIEGTADIAGEVLDAGIDTAGDAAAGVIGLAGDVVQNGADATGGMLRDLGGELGLETPFDAVAGVVEGGGKLISDVADVGADVVDTVTDVVGDGVEAVTDFAGDVGQGIADGAQWVGEKLNPLKWF